MILVPEAVSRAALCLGKHVRVDERGYYDDLYVRIPLLYPFSRRKSRVFVKGQDVHQHKIYVCPAAAFDLKGVSKRPCDVEPLVRAEYPGEVFLHIDIVFYKYCVYHIYSPVSGRLSSNANLGECAVSISPPAASTLRLSDESPLPSVILPFGFSPSLVIVTE